MSDGWPETPTSGDWPEIQRYAAIRLYAELFMADEVEWARMLGAQVPSHTEVWERAERFYEKVTV